MLVLYSAYAALGAVAYKAIIAPCFQNLMPDFLLFLIFALVWTLFYYVFIAAKNNLLSTFYKNIKNSFYKNSYKDLLYPKIVFCFCLITAVFCYIYSCTEENISFSDWISFIASVITLLGIPTLFSGFFADTVVKNKEEGSGKGDISYSFYNDLCISEEHPSESDACFIIGKKLQFRIRNPASVEITEKNSEGISVVVTEKSEFFNKEQRFCFDKEKNVLYVSNRLGNMSGDNLWLPMNEWYESDDGYGKYYPLINAQENRWHGNDEWSEQLNLFMEYLKKKGELKIIGDENSKA